MFYDTHLKIVLTLPLTVVFVEVKLFKDLLNENEVWKLKHIKRIQLVYALQNKYFLKASSEFLDVSETYMQVQTYQAFAFAMILVTCWNTCHVHLKTKSARFHIWKEVKRYTEGKDR